MWNLFCHYLFLISLFWCLRETLLRDCGISLVSSFVFLLITIFNVPTILQVAIECIENMRTVASLTKEKIFYKNFTKELSITHRAANSNAHIMGICYSFPQALIFFACAAVFFYGAYLIEEGEMQYVDVFK